MTEQIRKPQAFVINEDHPVAATKHQSRRTEPSIKIELQSHFEETGPLVSRAAKPLPTPRFFRWGMVLGTSAVILLMFWVGLGLVQLVQSYFAQSQILGWLVMSVVSVAILATLALLSREVLGILRLNQIGSLQDTAVKAINLDDATLATQTIADLYRLFAKRPDLSASLGDFASHNAEIMDPRDRILLAGHLLLTPLDQQAKKIIARHARRVTLLTAVTPVAALDILIVAAQNFSMLRDIATLYGGRPSSLATLRLSRMVLAHLAMAGGLALSDTLLQHFVGKGLLGRLSARFGEGTVNGVLTARIGLAAMTVCRPLPKDFSIRQELAGLLKEVVTPTAIETTQLDKLGMEK